MPKIVGYCECPVREGISREGIVVCNRCGLQVTYKDRFPTRSLEKMNAAINSDGDQVTQPQKSEESVSPATTPVKKKVAKKKAPTKSGASPKKPSKKTPAKKVVKKKAAAKKGPKPPTDIVKGGLRKPQMAILSALSNGKGLTRAQIVDKAGVNKARCTSLLGNLDKEKREKTDKRVGFSSLLTLKYISVKQEEQGDSMVNCFYITALGKKALVKATS